MFNVPHYDVLLYIGLILAGKVCSCLVYQACWSNLRDGRPHARGAFYAFLTRPTPWLTHIPVMLLMSSVTWQEFPYLRIYAVIATALLTVGSVFKLGAVDLSHFFVLDRLLAVFFAVGVFFSPLFLYPSILICCCLQYTTSAWPLGPGYSNLLGYEFIRGSSCRLLACLVVYGLISLAEVSRAGFEPIALAVVMGFQGSHYFNHAMAKAGLGRKWYSWVLQNRIQCLVVNAYLRGWASRWLTPRGVLRLAAAIARVRILLCAGVFALEFSFVLILFHQDFAVGLLLLAAGFHTVILLLTGLLEVEYVISHLAFTWLIVNGPLATIFGGEYFVASLLCAGIACVWVVKIRLRIFDEYQKTGAARCYGKLGDPADLLMAWWDSPYMRMFSYTAETAGGKHVAWPVPKLSPYDTALTDIHTHIMLLNAHLDLDPQAVKDQRIVRTGVWGLVITTAERDYLYRLMDTPEPDLSRLRLPPSVVPWEFSSSCDGPHSAALLRDLFSSMNRYQSRWWFRLLMRWPHFPGEDLAPDVCPICNEVTEHYSFDEPVIRVTMWRVKTFYTGDQIVLIEHVPVGMFEFGSPTGSGRSANDGANFGSGESCANSIC